MNLPQLDQSIDARREPRYTVSWRARIELPNGRFHEAKVRDISESGIGLQADFCPPTRSNLQLTLGVPDLDDHSHILAVPATLKVMFVVMQGHHFRIGGTWANIGPQAQHFMHQWVKRLRLGV
ncbi:MAG TPA: PilZ domain-containing protein [Burkholderiaceae bacterium]|nr:PilZ domain-containing protein [Burkholderiaceae bacterium]